MDDYRSYNFLGAHFTDIDGIDGVLFAVWAPNADAVNVTGDFNNWSGTANPMTKADDSGIWSVFIPGLREWDAYKYEIHAVVCNFTPAVCEGYRIGVPYNCKYCEIFNSDRMEPGGSGFNGTAVYYAKRQKWHNRDYMIEINIPPLAAVYFKPATISGEELTAEAVQLETPAASISLSSLSLR